MSDKKAIKLDEGTPQTGSDPVKKPDAKKSKQLIRWGKSEMATNFANVVNLQSTREQVDLYFGTNHAFAMDPEEADLQVQVELSNRLILTPHAAKRLSLALQDVLEKYEARYGQLRE